MSKEVTIKVFKSCFILGVFKSYVLNNKVLNCYVRCTYCVHVELQSTSAAIDGVTSKVRGRFGGLVRCNG